MVKGERDKAAPEKARILREDWTPSTLSKSFTLGDSIDRDSITAHTEDGVLTLTFSTLKGSGTKKIEIR